ncbi:MAG: DMT family transporter [Hyphomicrobiaceae bacterium]|nr:MAG: DMT family transporter [Hyphomicrobiaceae bacterium]
MSPLDARVPAERQIAHDNSRAITAMTGGMAAFVVSDAFIKVALGELLVGQAIALRGICAAIVVAALTYARGQLRWHRALLSPVMIMRMVSEIGASLFFFKALQGMTLADATAVLQSVPLILTAASALLLGEAVGWRRWAATVAGLAGVLIILRPGAGAFGPVALYALCAVLFISARDLVTRFVPKEIPSLLITTITAISLLIAGFILAAFEGWRPASALSYSLMLPAGLLIVVGHYTVIRALRAGDISLVAPFRYTAVPFSLVVGFAIWRDLPDVWSIAGTLLVIAAGLYTLHRERVRRRESL